PLAPAPKPRSGYRHRRRGPSAEAGHRGGSRTRPDPTAAGALTFHLRWTSGVPWGAPKLAPVKSILVVDDERNIVDLLRMYLEKEGFAVIAAGDGEQALALQQRHEPDLVILDLMLPKRDGFEVCREIRKRGETPVIMLTARG